MSKWYPCRVRHYGVVLSGLLFVIAGAASGAVQQGRAVAWGANNLFQTNVPPELTNVVAVASGHHHSLALLADGSVRGWGYDFFGQATPPPGLTNIVAIAAGGQHSLALRSNGRVVAWGDNSGRQTNVPPGLTSVARIAAGQFHSLALLSNGTVVAWGSGPTNVPGGLQAVAIAAGGNHSLALRANGTVAGWGQNTFGQINVGSLTQIRGLAAGDDFSVFILNDRTLHAIGNPAQGRTTPPAIGGVMAIAAGVSHGLALRNDGRLFAWGDNTSGQRSVPTNFVYWLGMGGGFSHSVGLVVIPPAIVNQPQSQSVTVGTPVNLTVRVSGSEPLSYRWRKNGALIAGGTAPTYNIAAAETNDSGNYTVIVTNLSGSVTSAVATLTVNAAPVIVTQPSSANVGFGQSNVFSVVAAGTAPLRYRWRHQGTNVPNATNNTLVLTNVQARHAGNYVVVVTNNHGAVTSAVATLTIENPPVILQHPRSQIVFEGAPFSLSVASTNASGYQWRKDGLPIAGATSAAYTVLHTQTNHAGEYSVLLTNAYGSTLSRTSVVQVLQKGTGGGEVVGWGESQIWDGQTDVPLSPPTLTNVVAISAGAQHSMALLRNGKVLAWGVNNDGQLNVPEGLEGVVEISAGGFHNLARTPGGVVAWGLNEHFQADVPVTLPTNVLAIAAGGFHSLALRTDGTVVGWGKPTQSIPPSHVGAALDVAAGTGFSLALKTNGTVAGWGTNDFGQARPPSDLTDVVAIAAGTHHSLALRRDGTVRAWGANGFGQLDIPGDVFDVIAIACGANHCLALKSDYTVRAWGHNNFGQTEVPTNLPPVIAIAAGGDRSLALTRSLLRLGPPQRVQGSLRVVVSSTGSIAAQRAADIEVYHSANPALPVAQWALLGRGLNPGLGNTWYFQDAFGAGPRFYITIERR